MPGDKQDVAEFLESAVSNTQLHLDLTVPNVSVFLPDRDFFEVIYNRWEWCCIFCCTKPLSKL